MSGNNQKCIAECVGAEIASRVYLSADTKYALYDAENGKVGTLVSLLQPSSDLVEKNFQLTLDQVNLELPDIASAIVLADDNPNLVQATPTVDLSPPSPSGIVYS